MTDPVAYMISDSLGALTEFLPAWRLNDFRHLNGDRWTLTPLYTHPPAQCAPAEVERLKAPGEPAAWWPIEGAPYDTPLTVRVGGMTFGAILRRRVSETTDGDPCDQWQALIEDEHPPCWTDGACWEINADGYGSREPEAFCTIPAQTSLGGAE